MKFVVALNLQSEKEARKKLPNRIQHTVKEVFFVDDEEIRRILRHLLLIKI